LFGIEELDIPNGYGTFTFAHVFLHPGRDEGKDSLDANAGGLLWFLMNVIYL